MKKVRESHLNVLMKYDMFLEALRRDEGFRRETDKAFAKFWEREGESLRKEQIVLIDAEGNRKSYKSLGELLGESFGNRIPTRRCSIDIAILQRLVM